MPKVSVPIVRAWNAADITLCAALDDAENPSGWELAQFQQSFDAQHIGFVLEEESGILGCLVGSALFETADLLYIEVAPSAKGTGAAQQLLQAFADHCRDLGVEKILLEVRASNQRAQGFYKKQGFSQISIRRSYYSATEQNPAEDALIFQYNF